MAHIDDPGQLTSRLLLEGLSSSIGNAMHSLERESVDLRIKSVGWFGFEAVLRGACMLRERVKEGENKEGSPQSLGGRLKEIPKEEGSALTENLSH